MLKIFGEKNYVKKMEKTQIVLYIYRKRFRTVFVGVVPPLNKFFFPGGMSFD